MATYYGVNEDSYLSHYGVKGMKWGVRKERRTTGKRFSAVREKPKAEVLAKNIFARGSEWQKKINKDLNTIDAKMEALSRQRMLKEERGEDTSEIESSFKSLIKAYNKAYYKKTDGLYPSIGANSQRFLVARRNKIEAAYKEYRSWIYNEGAKMRADLEKQYPSVSLLRNPNASGYFAEVDRRKQKYDGMRSKYSNKEIASLATAYLQDIGYDKKQAASMTMRGNEVTPLAYEITSGNKELTNLRRIPAGLPRVDD